MPNYRNVSNARLTIPKLGIVVGPGEIFSSPFPIDDGNYELVKDKKAAAETAVEG